MLDKSVDVFGWTYLEYKTFFVLPGHQYWTAVQDTNIFLDKQEIVGVLVTRESRSRVTFADVKCNDDGDILEIVPAEVFARKQQDSATDEMLPAAEGADGKDGRQFSDIDNHSFDEGKRNEFKILQPGLHTVVSYIW